MKVDFLNVDDVGGERVFKFEVGSFLGSDEEKGESELGQGIDDLMHPCGDAARDIGIGAFQQEADVGFGGEGLFHKSGGFGAQGAGWGEFAGPKADAFVVIFRGMGHVSRKLRQQRVFASQKSGLHFEKRFCFTRE